MIEGQQGSRIERMTDRFVWSRDRGLLNDVVFRLQLTKNDETWDLGDQCVVLFKGNFMVNKYRDLFRRNPQLKVEHMLELGIYEGGSIALWRELLAPKRMAAIDIGEKLSRPYLEAYLERVRNETETFIHWEFDQGDKPRLRKLVAEDLQGKLDLVIDDASHMYGPTMASFEALFPLVRPGGVYIIEDWAWNHWEDHAPADHPWAGERSPSELIFQLMEGLGGTTIGVEHIESYLPFVALFRDDTELPADFSLPGSIRRRAQTEYSWWRR